MTPTFTGVLKQLRNEIWWIGKFTSDYFFRYLKLIDLDMVSYINILTSHSRTDKEFFLHLSAFWSYCQEKIRTRKTVINVKVFLPNAEPSDDEEMYVFDENNGIRTLGLDANSIDHCIAIDIPKIEDLKSTYESALSVSGLDNILRIKIESLYEISSRKIPQKVKEELSDAVLLYDKSSPKTGIFELVGVYEKYVREFIKYRLNRRAPVNWYAKYVDAFLENDERGRIEKIFNEDQRREAERIKDVPNPLKYFDCKYYPIIIERIKRANVRLLKDVEEDLLVDMKRIPQYRNPAYHHRDAFLRDAIPLVIRILVSLNAIEDLERFG